MSADDNLGEKQQQQQQQQLNPIDAKLKSLSPVSKQRSRATAAKDARGAAQQRNSPASSPRGPDSPRLRELDNELRV